MPRSLRGRLALGIGVGATLVLAISFVSVHLLIRHELYAWLDADLRERMNAVAEYAMHHPGREDVVEFMPDFRTRSHQDFFQVWDQGRQTLARSDSSIGRDLPLLHAVVAKPTYHDLTLPDGHRGRAVAQLFDLPAGDERARLTVVMAEETENLDALEARIHVTLFAVSLVAVVALLLIAMYTIGRGLKPVADFTRSLAAVDSDDPSSRLETGPLPCELQPVAIRFSALLDRLLGALAREKRYARNVAHELRNPLAEIRLLADVSAANGDPGACQEAVRDIRATASEMERIVDALMALTRYEAGIEAPQPEPINLAAELRREVQKLAHAASQRSLTLSLEVPDEVWVYADSSLAHHLLGNLLGNAVSHSPKGSTVSVSLARTGDLKLANPAPHLALKDVPRLGERFYRVDSSDERGAHAGLGLSLAEAIARAMGLNVTWALHDNGCLVSSVQGFQSVGQA